jgi:hypothetical protein
MSKLFSPTKIVLFVTIISLSLRLSVAALFPMPSNDGGLFSTMSLELKANNLLLPKFTSYNQNHIPFSYPPLGLYISALLLYTHISIINLDRFLPPIISVFSIPAFFLLASSLTASKKYGALATLAFAMIPRSFLWIAMGGGLTRSFGQLFSLLCLYFSHTYLTLPSKKLLFLSSLFFALTILAHPEWALFTAISLLTIFIFLSPNLSGLKFLSRLIPFTFILILPWLALIYHYHGLSPFLSSASTGFWNLESLKPFFNFNFTDEPGLPFFAATGLLSLATLVFQSQFLLPVWVAVSFISNPRAADNYCVIPLAISIASVLGRPLLAFFPHKPHTVTLLAAVTLAIPLLVNFFSYPLVLGRYLNSISSHSYAAMDWVKSNTSSTSQFLVISPDTFNIWAIDRTAEWFPVISQRRSLTTVQGLEWTPNNQFKHLASHLARLKPCQHQGLTCLETWAANSELSYSHIFISLPLSTTPACCSLLLHDLSSSSNYTRLFQNVETSVWQKLK